MRVRGGVGGQCEQLCVFNYAQLGKVQTALTLHFLLRHAILLGWCEWGVRL